MTGLRDYQKWHTHYDDPASSLSWRLRTVQAQLQTALDGRPGTVRVLNLCPGDGRDIIGVAAARGDGHRLRATFVEIDPQLAATARTRAAAAGLVDADVRTADAGHTETYADAVPADLVLLVGIFGNISPDDMRRTVAAAPQLCSTGATLLWSRGRSGQDLNTDVRRWFTEAGFSELDYQTQEGQGRPALGVLRYDGDERPLQPARLFSFLR